MIMKLGMQFFFLLGLITLLIKIWCPNIWFAFQISIEWVIIIHCKGNFFQKQLFHKSEYWLFCQFLWLFMNFLWQNQMCFWKSDKKRKSFYSGPFGKQFKKWHKSECGLLRLLLLKKIDLCHDCITGLSQNHSDWNHLYTSPHQYYQNLSLRSLHQNPTLVC